jgi:hypothetical protein
MLARRHHALGALLAAPVVLSAWLQLAHAGITPEARAVVDRYVTVTGGSDVFAAESTVHERGRIVAFGLTGTFEAWNERPSRTANVTSIGPFTLREGTDGDLAWRVDQNGKFTERDGKDLEDALASAYFQNEMWGLPDQGGGAVSFVATEIDSGATFSVLEAAPPVGRPRRLWFNVKTGLLERVVLRDDARTVTSRLSDYREMAGRLRATVTLVTIEGMPMNDARVELDSLSVNEEFAADVFAPARTSIHDVRFLAGGGRAVIPFQYLARHVWVRASVNGGPLEDFLVDTGASITVIDSAFAARRGMKVEGRVGVAGAGSAGGAAFSQVDSIVVPGDSSGVHLAAQKVAVLAVNAFLEPFFWRPCAGVLGYDFISRFVVTVDYDHRRLVLEDLATFAYHGTGRPVPLEMAGNIPVVEAVLDDTLSGKFRLDVGSSGSVDLHAPFVAKHDLVARARQPLTVTSAGFGGTFTSQLTRMNTMAIGPFSWDQPLVALSQARTGGLASEDYAGNIGNQVLERFAVTFDYEHRTVYLEPGARFTKRDRFTLAGVQLVREEGEVIAMQVLPGSAAADAGLEAGDRVRKLDRKPIGTYTLDAVTRMFEEGAPGERHTLEIERAGRKKKLELRLKEQV